MQYSLAGLLQRPLAIVSIKCREWDAESGYDRLFVAAFRLLLSAVGRNETRRVSIAGTVKSVNIFLRGFSSFSLWDSLSHSPLGFLKKENRRGKIEVLRNPQHVLPNRSKPLHQNHEPGKNQNQTVKQIHNPRSRNPARQYWGSREQVVPAEDRRRRPSGNQKRRHHNQNRTLWRSLGRRISAQQFSENWGLPGNTATKGRTKTQNHHSEG
ncbi:MAG: hypothetical protein IID46_13590 [Planctomycetes bacterium]|nr:hypothetical protein [Planctomycetota bacterium]